MSARGRRVRAWITNIALLIELLEHSRFVAGSIDTGFLDEEGDAIRARLSVEPPAIVEAVAAAARASRRAGPFGPAGAGPFRPADDTDPWTSLRGARV